MISRFQDRWCPRCSPASNAPGDRVCPSGQNTPTTCVVGVSYGGDNHPTVTRIAHHLYQCSIFVNRTAVVGFGLMSYETVADNQFVILWGIDDNRMETEGFIEGGKARTSAIQHFQAEVAEVG